MNTSLEQHPSPSLIAQHIAQKASWIISNASQLNLEKVRRALEDELSLEKGMLDDERTARVVADTVDAVLVQALPQILASRVRVGWGAHNRGCGWMCAALAAGTAACTQAARTVGAEKPRDSRDTQAACAPPTSSGDTSADSAQGCATIPRVVSNGRPSNRAAIVAAAARRRPVVVPVPPIRQGNNRHAPRGFQIQAAKGAGKAADAGNVLEGMQQQQDMVVVSATHHDGGAGLQKQQQQPTSHARDVHGDTHAEGESGGESAEAPPTPPDAPPTPPDAPPTLPASCRAQPSPPTPSLAAPPAKEGGSGTPPARGGPTSTRGPATRSRAAHVPGGVAGGVAVAHPPPTGVGSIEQERYARWLREKEERRKRDEERSSRKVCA